MSKVAERADFASESLADAVNNVADSPSELGGSVDEVGQPWLDARVHGDVTREFLDHPIEIAYGKSANHPRGKWKNVSSPLGKLVERLATHAVGAKDGACVLQGAVISGNRQAQAIKHLDILMLDLDTGESIAAIRSRIQEKGLFAVLWTTHSHMKATSEVKKDTVYKYAGLEVGDEPTAEHVITYLREVKRYQPAVLVGAELLPTKHTENGVMMVLRHQPMQKFRVLFLLKNRFVVGDRAGRHKDGITEWHERYAGVSAMLGAFYDRSCVDPSRLMYLPRHAEGAPYQIDVIAGAALDLDSLERVGKESRKVSVTDNDYSAAAADMGGSDDRREYATKGIKRFIAKHSANFEMDDFLIATDPDGDRGPRSHDAGRAHRCPNDDDHSDAGNSEDKGFFCVNGSEAAKGFAAKCMHDSCSDLDRLAMLDKACENVGITDAADLQQWVADTVDEVEVEAKPKPAKDEEGCLAVALVAREAASSVPAASKGATKNSSDKELDNLDEMVRDFNNNHAILAEGGGQYVIFGPDGMDFKSKTAFELYYADRKYFYKDSAGATRAMSFVKAWREYPSARRYVGSCFRPGIAPKSDDKRLNLFEGLGLIPCKGDWSLLKRHLLDVICGGDFAAFEYVMAWQAYHIQNLGDLSRKLPRSIVVKGVHGCGKSLYWQAYGSIFGKHHVTLSKPDQVIGRFNVLLGRAVFVVLEEALYAGDPKARDALKELLSGKRQVIERKGVDAVEVDNFAQFVILSNSARPVDLNPTERRFYVLEASAARVGDVDYFTALADEIDIGGAAAMAWDLMHYSPAGGFGFLWETPRTDAGAAMIAEGLSSLDRYVLDSVHAGEFGPMTAMKLARDGKKIWVATSDLAAAFANFTESGATPFERQRTEMSTNSIGRRLAKIFKGTVIVSEKNSAGIMGWKFPDHAACLEAMKGHANAGYKAYLHQAADPCGIEDAGAPDGDQRGASLFLAGWDMTLAGDDSVY